VEHIECISDGRPTKLKFVAPGKLDRQTLRVPRQLTPASAHLLDRQIDEYGARPRANVWVFQYLQSYDIEHQVATESPVDAWQANQRRYDMHVGDRIYFRRATGPQPSGITAVGSLVSPVRTTDVPDRPYEVDVLYEMRVVPVLGGDDIRQDDTLRQCYALEHGQSGTNFLLSAQEAERLEHMVEERLESFLSVKPGFSPDVKYDARTRGLVAVVQRRGQTEFRNRLIDAYGGRCAVTGCDAVDALEAAHIQPYLGQHSNHVTNGLLLRADIHTLFDLGLLTIDSTSMAVLLHPTLALTTYATLAGTKLRQPQNPSMRPSVEALNTHRQQAGF
jgi:hypothetical protein